jgi:hypothetical protein
MRCKYVYVLDVGLVLPTIDSGDHDDEDLARQHTYKLATQHDG